MTFETWFAFALSYALLSALPGPSTMTVVAQTLAGGFRAGLRCIAGDLLGGVAIVGAAYGGLGAVLASSSAAFFALKWAGVLYLGWMGWRQIWQARWIASANLRQGSRNSLLTGFLTGALNPKAIIFYMAFLAQFLDAKAALGPQMLVVLATSSVIVAAVLLAYAAFAARMAEIWRGLRAQKTLSYASGTLLLGGSLWMASTR